MSEAGVPFFNLVDEPWIPVADAGRVSLREIFSERGSDFRALGGNPVQKIAVTKLLLAIAQAAATPKDAAAWDELGPEGMIQACKDYLEKWHDRFWLYHSERPFLQLPAVSVAEVKSYGVVLPDVATGNTTVLTESQVERPFDDAEKALLLITLMGFALGGKKADNSVLLTTGYQGKKKSAKPGPALAYLGLLHSFVVGRSLSETLWLNLITEAELAAWGMFSGGVGCPPWEKMPAGEACPVAEELKTTLIGRLIHLCRFSLLVPEGLHFTEGLQHMNYAEGIYDPTVAADRSKKKIRVLWADPGKRPWRQLPALLGFVKQGGSSFDCFQLRVSLSRARRRVKEFAVWSGGLRVSSNAGEQYVSGSDDFVESEIWLAADYLDETWFSRLQFEMKGLEEVGKQLYGSIRGYFAMLKAEGDKLAAQGGTLFWQQAENRFSDLLEACDLEGGASEDELIVLRRYFAAVARAIFDRCCPADTARQLEAWARSRPRFGNYLKG